MIIRMLQIIIRMNRMIFGLPWMKWAYGVSEEGRLRLRRMRLLMLAHQQYLRNRVG